MTDLFPAHRMRGGVTDADRDERARRAVKVFRSMQFSLTSFARAITGNPKISVEMKAGTPHTDGKKIYYQPPIALGDPTEHERRLCEKRDETKLLLCPACAMREKVMVNIFHEIGHIAFDSFKETTDADRKRALTEAVEEWGGKYADRIKARIESTPWEVTRSYMGLASLISPFLPYLVNCIEDARVDSAMFEARNGVRTMMQADMHQLFSQGTENPDGTVTMWRDMPLNSQASVGCYIIGAGFGGWEEWLHPEVVTALKDEKLNEILAEVRHAGSATDTYNLSFPVLARLRELGFFKRPDDPEEEDESGQQPEEPEESDDSEGEGSEAEGSDSGDDSDEAPEEGEGSPDEGDSGDESEEGSNPGDSEGEESGDEPSGESEEDGAGGDSADGPSDEEGEVDEAGSPDSDDVPGEHDDESSESGEGDSQGEEPGEGSDGVPSDDDQSTGDSEGEPDDEGSGQGSEDSDPSEGDAGNDDGSTEDDDSEPSTGDSTGGADERNESGDAAAGEDEDPSEGGSDDLTEGYGGQGTDDDTDRESREGDGPENDHLDSTDPAEGEASDERIDTGADEGEGGLEVPTPEYGDPEDVGVAISQLHKDEVSIDHHQDDKPDAKAVEVAIIQGLYFETPSTKVLGVREHTFGVPTIEGGQRVDQAWANDRYAQFGDRYALGIEIDLDVSESVLGPALLQTRRVFTDNAKANHQHNLKTGRIDKRVLGRRAWNDDPRLFSKKRLPGKRSYAVLIGIDVSGSTIGENLALAKRAAWAQAELCARVGIDFAVYAHSASGVAGRIGRSGPLHLDIYKIKEFGEPWDPKVQERLKELGSDSENLDGHTIEYYRKRLDEVNATDKIILYYTDGKMPAANHDEELEILQREIKVCKQKSYTLLGVGIRTDSPIRHGLDTVQVNDDSDLKSVVMHLEKVLVRR